VAALPSFRELLDRELILNQVQEHVFGIRKKSPSPRGGRRVGMRGRRRRPALGVLGSSGVFKLREGRWLPAAGNPTLILGPSP